MLVPLTIAHFWLFKKGSTLRVLSEEEQGDEYIPEIPNRSRRMIFVIGVLSLALVPVFQMVTNLPPFLGVLLGLVILWFYTDLMYSKLHMHESQKLRISQLLPNIDLATIFFFLGILMAVGALETSGQLGIMSAFLDKHVHEPYLISFVIGALSSCVDNVALELHGLHGLLLQGLLDLHAGLGGDDEVQPIPLRALRRRRDHGYAIAVVQGVFDRYVLPVHFSRYAFASQLRVDGKGEIEDRRSLGQLDKLAGRREDVDLILI